MSLLMDALKKAEEAKRARQPAPGADLAAELALEPYAAPEEAAATTSTQSAEAPAAAAVASRQQAARNVFAVKAAPRRSSFALWIGAATAAAILLIGAWLWWQLRPQPPLLRPTPTPPPPLVTAAPLPLPPVPVPATAAIVEAAPPVVPPVATPARSAEKAAAAEPPQESPVRLTARKPTVNPLALEAYDALQAGNLAQAQQLYQKLLAADAYNPDALYGLAAIALHKGQPQLAEQHYLRALEADPRDAVALAGMAGLRERALGENTESRLKLLLAEQPSPALYFALGNFYARASRWPEAQQNYFLAFQADSSNPDVAFNLAVSLDQIRQPKLAAQYYQEALKLSERRPVAFRPEDVRTRLRELMP